MDMTKWESCAWTPEAWDAAQAELTADVEAQLAANGLKVVKTLPNMFTLGVVAANAENTKWIHITTADVRTAADWAANVKLRRMSSERDWKGDAFHFVPWVEIGEGAAKYMGDEYDEEIL